MWLYFKYFTGNFFEEEVSARGRLIHSEVFTFKVNFPSKDEKLQCFSEIK